MTKKTNILTGHVMRDHVLIGGGAALILMPWLTPMGSLAFWVGTVFIDVDHYLEFVHRSGFRRWGIRSMFDYYEAVFERKDRKDFLAISLFHTVEFFGFAFSLAFIFEGYALAVVYGALWHIATDFVHLWRHNALRKRSHSVFHYFWKHRQMRTQNLDPDSAFKEALGVIGL